MYVSLHRIEIGAERCMTCLWLGNEQLVPLLVLFICYSAGLSEGVVHFKIHSISYHYCIAQNFDGGKFEILDTFQLDRQNLTHHSV